VSPQRVDVGKTNKTLARYWFHEGWTLGHVEVAEQVFAPHFALRGRVVGPDGPRRSVLARRAAFADLSATVEHQVADGDLVVTHFSTQARHTGSFQGLAPTGRWVRAEGIVIWRVEDGRVVEDWNVFDLQAIVTQLKREERS